MKHSIVILMTLALGACGGGGGSGEETRSITPPADEATSETIELTSEEVIVSSTTTINLFQSGAGEFYTDSTVVAVMDQTPVDLDRGYDWVYDQTFGGACPIRTAVVTYNITGNEIDTLTLGNLEISSILAPCVYSSDSSNIVSPLLSLHPLMKPILLLTTSVTPDQLLSAIVQSGTTDLSGIYDKATITIDEFSANGIVYSYHRADGKTQTISFK